MVQKLQQPPFRPVVPFDTDGLFTMDDLEQVLVENPEGISLCLRYADGNEARGGYFFHFKASSTNKNVLTLLDFEDQKIANLEKPQLVALINHCSGRQYDEESFKFCQTTVNFRTDE